MAVAVLKGDLVAARALADLLTGEYSEGAKEIPSVRRLTVPTSRVRAIVYIRDFPDVTHLEVDEEGIKRAVRDWLNRPANLDQDPGTLVVLGVDRIELFELPYLSSTDEVEDIPKQAITLAARELLKRGKE